MNTKTPKFLNGWRRLWIVCSIALFILELTAFNLLNSDPTDTYKKELIGWQDQMLKIKQSQSKNSAECDRALKSSPDDTVEQAFAKFFCRTEQEKVRDLQKKIDDTKHSISLSQAEQHNIIKYGLIQYFAVVIGIYLFGEGIAWTRRGFKSGI